MTQTKHHVLASVQFEPYLLEYNEYYMQYRNMALLVVEKFVKDYREKCKNLDSVVKSGIDIAKNYIVATLDMVVNDLIKEFKIYELNYDTFVDQFYLDYFDFFEYTDKITDPYAELVLHSEELEQYRELRKQNRGRIVGGGFGISGAAKGIAIAGAANAATGVAHSIFNSFGKAVSNARINNAKAEAYNSGAPLNILKEGLYQNILAIHLAVIDFLNHMQIKSIKTLTPDDIQKSENIFSNLKKGLVEAEEVPLLLANVIEKNPYDIDPFIYLCDQYGDENQEVEQLASQFGHDLFDYKKSVLRKKVNQISKLSSATQIRYDINQLKQSFQYLGFNNQTSKDWMTKLEAHYSHKEQEERTLDGIVFESVALLKKALKEKKQLEEIVSNHVMKTSDDVQALISIVEAKTWETAYYEAKLEELYDKFAKHKNEEDEAAELAQIAKIVGHSVNNSTNLAPKVAELQAASFTTEAGKQKVREYSEKVKSLRNAEAKAAEDRKSLEEFQNKELLKKALEHQKRKDANILVKLGKLTLIALFIIIGTTLFNIIGLIVTGLIVIGYYASCKEERDAWKQLTQNGTKSLRD